MLYHAAATGLPVLADPGYDGAGIGIHIPVKQPAGGRELDVDTRTRNAIQRSLRCLGERGFALVTGAGASSSTLPPAPARSASSPAQPWYSPISSTAILPSLNDHGSGSPIRRSDSWGLPVRLLGRARVR